MYAIYALLDPDDIYKVCYIGITQDIYQRFTQHLHDISGTTPKAKWLRELRDRNRVPYCKVLEDMLTEEEARKREIHWIHFYESLNMPLTNVSIPHIPHPPHMDIKPSYEEAILEFYDKGMSGRDIERLMKDKGTSYYKISQILFAHRPGWNKRNSIATESNTIVTDVIPMQNEEPAV